MFKRIISAAFIAALAISVQAQQQTGLLTNQIPLHGAGEGKTVDLSSLRYISFAANDAYVIKKNGSQAYGTMHLAKIQNMASWKDYIAVTPTLFLNTRGIDSDCVNGQTILEFAAPGAIEARNDGCALRDRIKAQSDTSQ